MAGAGEACIGSHYDASRGCKHNIAPPPCRKAQSQNRDDTTAVSIYTHLLFFFWYRYLVNDQAAIVRERSKHRVMTCLCACTVSETPSTDFTRLRRRSPFSRRILRPLLLFRRHALNRSQFPFRLHSLSAWVRLVILLSFFVGVDTPRPLLAVTCSPRVHYEGTRKKLCLPWQRGDFCASLGSLVSSSPRRCENS